jgi:hypothetical protein
MATSLPAIHQVAASSLEMLGDLHDNLFALEVAQSTVARDSCEAKWRCNVDCSNFVATISDLS